MTRTQKFALTVVAVLEVLAVAASLRRKLGGAPPLALGPRPR